MTWHQPERIYGVRELTRILTLTPKRAAQLRRLELLRGESGYTFRDLLAMRAASALLAAGSAGKHDPRCCEAEYNLGSLHEDRGLIEEAIADYREALEISPDYADAHFNLAGALARAERGQEAIEHWQRYLELDAGSPWARIARAHLELVEPPDQTQSE